MATRWKSFQIEPIGGLNLDENPNAVRKDEIIEALNVYYRGSTLGTRPGTLRETEGSGYTAAFGGAVQGGYEWRRDNDATRNLMVVANGTVYSTAVAGTPTALTNGAGMTITAGADLRWTFAEMGYSSGTSQNARIYAAGGASTDTPWYWDGSAGTSTLLSILNSAGAAVYPEYIFQKWKRIFACKWRTVAGGISTDITANPMTPRYSALFDGLTWPTGNTFAGTGIGGLPAYGNEYLTGFGEFTDNDGDWLLLLSNRKLYAVQEDPANPSTPFYISRRGAIEFGCVSQRAFVSLGLDSGDAVYLSDHGIHSLRSTQQHGPAADHMLSWKIRAFFRTLNRSRFQYACGSYLREEGLVVFAVPVGSESANNVLLVLDLKMTTDAEDITSKNARWSIWRMSGSSANRNVTTLFSARSSAGKPYLYGGNQAGSLFRFDENASDDLGTAYESGFSTRWEHFGDPTSSKTLGDMYVNLQPSRFPLSDVALRVTTDFGARATGPYPLTLPGSSAGVWNVGVWDTATWGTSTATNLQRVYAQAHGAYMSFRIANNAAFPFYVAGIAGRVAGFSTAREVA